MKYILKLWLYLAAFILLTAGAIGIVYSWPLFLLAVLTVSLAVLAWFFLPQVLIALPALLPFQPALNPTQDIDLAAGRLAITFLAAVGGLYVIYKKKAWFNLSTSTILIIFLLAWSLFSGIMADDFGRYVRKYLVFLTVFPLYFLLLAFLRKKKEWRKLFYFWSWSAFFVSLIGLGQFLFQFVGGKERFFSFWGKFVAPFLYGAGTAESIIKSPSWFVGVSGTDILRAIGTFPDPHMLAFFLGMSLPLQVVLVLEKKKKYLWVLPGLALLVLLLTFSRGSYVGLAGVLVWLAIYTWRNFPAGRQRIVIGILLIFLGSSLLAPVRDRFYSILDFTEGSNRDRLKIWDDALNVIIDNPLLGVGLGNYTSAVRPEAQLREPIYAHNTYLDLGSETGFPGMLAWILLMISGIRPLLLAMESSSGIISKTQDGKYKAYDLAAALGIFWFSLHALFETPLFSPQILPLILTLLAFRAFIGNKAKIYA